jgi:hypothetical protein
MHPYLPHLLHDLRHAHRPDDDESISSPPSIEEELEAVERYIGTDPEISLGQHCGLTKELFPPVEIWSDSELKEIIGEFNNMLFSWGVSADLPENLPLSLTYHFLVLTLDKKIHLIPKGGFTHLEFCSYDPTKCPFGNDYCTCQKYYEEEV